MKTIKRQCRVLDRFGAVLLPFSQLTSLTWHRAYYSTCVEAILNGAEAGDQPGAQRRHIEHDEFLEATHRFLRQTGADKILSQYFKSKRLRVNYVRARNPLRFKGKQTFHRDDLMLKGGRSLIECFFFMSDVTALSGGIEYAKIVSLGRIGASPKNINRVHAKRGDLLLIKSQILHRGTTRYSKKSRWILSFQVGTR